MDGVFEMSAALSWCRCSERRSLRRQLLLRSPGHGPGVGAAEAGGGPAAAAFGVTFAR